VLPDSVTKVSWTYSTLPVPPAPLKQPTANATVPPEEGRLVALMSSPMGAWNVALVIGAAGAFTTFEMRLAKDPSVLNSDTTAEPRKPVGHASVVDQVGWLEEAPVAGLRVRLPGSRVLAPRASPAVSRPAPAIMPTAPRSTNSLRIPVAPRSRAAASYSDPAR
jgi:hypothetical protein